MNLQFMRRGVLVIGCQAAFGLLAGCGQSEKVGDKMKEMSPEQKSVLTGAAAKAMPQLEGGFNRVVGLEGVGNVVGPVLESLQSKLKNLN